MKKLFVANWKMNPQSIKEAEIIFKGTANIAKGSKNSSIIVCSPFPFLYLVRKLKLKKISLGAQDVSPEPTGAHTGDVSAKMLTSLGVTHVIVGHSERRTLGDTNDIVNKKIIMALKSKLCPILCVGENVRDNSGSYLSFIKQELHECLLSVGKAQMKNIIVAYEPVWAIGEKALREATVEEFIEMKIFIRKVISDIYDTKTAHNTPILYGGSVHPENAKEFLVHGGADGFLVGRDSLVPKKFNLIVDSIK